MSYRCQGCREQQKPRSKPHRVPVRLREARYAPRSNQKGDVIDYGGRGVEVAQEENLCNTCYQAYQSGEGPLWALLTAAPPTVPSLQ